MMADHVNGLVCTARTRIPTPESAVRSARLLARCLKEGVAPRMRMRNAPILWPPTGTGTADSPMRDLEARAREIENADPSIWAVNVVAGFSFSDVRDAGVAFSLVTTGSDAAADAALASLVDLATALRANGLPEEWTSMRRLPPQAEIGSGPASS